MTEPNDIVQHVRTRAAYPFGPHGDPENGADCAGTLCEVCGCCQHCEHPCHCDECGCIEHAETMTTFPSVESEPSALVAEIERLAQTVVQQAEEASGIATAYHQRIERQSQRIRDHEQHIARLCDEREQQAAELAELREQVEHWRGHSDEYRHHFTSQMTATAEERKRADRAEAALSALAGEQSKPNCTGLSASWCPIHGDCCCPRNLVSGDFEHQSDDRCPLHNYESSHGEQS